MTTSREGTAAVRSHLRAETEGPPRLEQRADLSARVAAIFERLAARGAESSLGRTSGVFLFNIAGAGRWCLALESGVPRLETAALAPDCVIGCAAGDFVEVAEGRSNLVTAFLQGRVTCSGNVALALGFRRLLPVF